MTKKEPTKTNVEQTVMEQISSGEVQMKSKWHFIFLQAILIASASLFSVLAAIFISLSVHDIRIGQRLNLNEFGEVGDAAFRGALPLLMILFAVIAVSTVVLLAKHFEFSYRHKFNALLATALFTIAGLSGLVTAVGLNDDLADAPPFKPLSTLKKLADENRIIGTVEQVEGDYYQITMPDGAMVDVKVAEKTRYKNKPQVGDDVVIFGKYSADTEFEAYGVRIGKPRVRHPLEEHEHIKGAHRHGGPFMPFEFDEINPNFAE